jgi:hypothetical protein
VTLALMDANVMEKSSHMRVIFQNARSGHPFNLMLVLSNLWVRIA